MTESNHANPQSNPDKFDGIVDNTVPGMPWPMTLLFWALIAWAVVFAGYYLFSGWSSAAEYDGKQAAFNAGRGE